MISRSIYSGFLMIACALVAASAQAADLEKGKQLFGTRCSTCHGNEGKGDGPVALSLPPEMKPRNLATEANKFATDEAKFKELLKKGGSGVGLNPLMPPQPDLSDADVASLYAFVKSLKK